MASPCLAIPTRVYSPVVFLIGILLALGCDKIEKSFEEEAPDLERILDPANWEYLPAWNRLFDGPIGYNEIIQMIVFYPDETLAERAAILDRLSSQDKKNYFARWFYGLISEDPAFLKEKVGLLRAFQRQDYFEIGDNGDILLSLAMTPSEKAFELLEKVKPNESTGVDYSYWEGCRAARYRRLTDSLTTEATKFTGLTELDFILANGAPGIGLKDAATSSEAFRAALDTRDGEFLKSAGRKRVVYKDEMLTFDQGTWRRETLNPEHLENSDILELRVWPFDWVRDDFALLCYEVKYWPRAEKRGTFERYLLTCQRQQGEWKLRGIWMYMIGTPVPYSKTRSQTTERDGE